MRRDKPSKEQSGPTKKYGRQVLYDREIFITICMKMLRGEHPEDICASPPMPVALVFLDWHKEHKEAREIYRAMENFRSDRTVGKEFGVPLPVSIGEWAEQVRANCERGWPADWIDREYIRPDWSKVYPLVGEPPVLSTENRQAYDDLIDTYTKAVEPRDEIELVLTKQAVDEQWGACRIAREKTDLIERKHREWLQFVAQYRGRSNAAGRSLAKSATAPDYSRGILASPDYQALDKAHSRAIERRNDACRQITQYRRHLGAAPRALPYKFLDEDVLAHRYGVDRYRVDDRRGDGSSFGQLVADAENDPTAGEAVEPGLGGAPAGARQAAPPPVARWEKVAEATPSVPPAEAAQRAASHDNGARSSNCSSWASCSSERFAGAAPDLAPADEGVPVAPPIASLEQAAAPRVAAAKRPRYLPRHRSARRTVPQKLHSLKAPGAGQRDRAPKHLGEAKRGGRWNG
jgi:hypothetical protein